jgi:uncharacterized protein (TIGR03000 family)
MRKTCWKKTSVAALVLLGLGGVALPNGRAQLDFDGGFVPIRRDPSDIPPWPAPAHASPGTANPPSRGSPDHDFGYLPSSPLTTAVTRSDYSGGATSGRSTGALGGGTRFAVSAAALPWNRADFKGYHESRDLTPSAPTKFLLDTTALPQRTAPAEPTAALLIAHLPEHALLWVDGTRTQSTGQTRFFQTPALSPGNMYSYTVRAAWLEDGRWVSQTRKVVVGAGLVQTIYLRTAVRSAKE